MKKLILAIATVGVAVMPLLAQHPADPDKKVAGGGSLPSGWKGRLDSGDKSLAGVKAAGAYEAHATFTQMEPAAHPEAYGLIIGGSDLDGAGQKYTYFLVRQDGKFLIKRRAGEATPTVTDWTDNAAIKKPDATGKSTNTLAIEVGKDKVRFLINGTQVTATDASRVDANGIAGLRINHNLNVNVEAFAVKTR